MEVSFTAVMKIRPQEGSPSASIQVWKTSRSGAVYILLKRLALVIFLPEESLKSTKSEYGLAGLSA